MAVGVAPLAPTPRKLGIRSAVQPVNRLSARFVPAVGAALEGADTVVVVVVVVDPQLEQPMERSVYPAPLDCLDLNRPRQLQAEECKNQPKSLHGNADTIEVGLLDHLPNTISASLLPVFGTNGIVFTFVEANVLANGGTYGMAVLTLDTDWFDSTLSSGSIRMGIRCKYP